MPGDLRMLGILGQQDLKVLRLAAPQMRGEDLGDGLRRRFRLLLLLGTDRVALVCTIGLHHLWVGCDVHRRLGGSEYHSVAVGDHPPVGQQLARVLHLLRRLRGECLGLQGLQLDGTPNADDHQQQQGHHERADAHAGTAQGHPPHAAVTPAMRRPAGCRPAPGAARWTRTHCSPISVCAVACPAGSCVCWAAGGVGSGVAVAAGWRDGERPVR